MTDNDSTAGPSSAGTRPAGLPPDHADEISYPENQVAGVVDAARLRPALDALEAEGFVESDLQVRCGRAYADQLDAVTGRTGLLDRVLRFAERIGVPNDEMDVKNTYEEAIRSGGFLVLAQAPSDERRDRAAAILRAHDTRHGNYFGRFTIERL